MPAHRPRTPRPRHLSLALALSGILLAALAHPVSAATVPARGSAHLGVGVVAHDGQDGTPTGGDATQTEGVDVSAYQGNAAWSTLWSSGVKWAYTKATEGTYYTNPYFAQQYNGSYGVGMIRGAYHFATPGRRAAPPRPTTSSTTAAAGPGTAAPSPASWTSSGIRTARPATASRRRRW